MANDANDQDALIAMLAECLEIEPAALSPETEIESVEEWTSIAWLTIMARVDESWGVEMSASDIRKWRTVREVLDYLKQAKA